jgi:hypothetical protein
VTTAQGRVPRPDFFSRFLSAVPLLTVYFGFAALYAWQASRHPVPTIFIDEIEMTQLSRAISETGEPARRGLPYGGLATLVAYVLAPVWWLGSTTAGYAAAKLVLVLAMTATVFPAYGLARLVVSRWYALGAAAAAVAVPALAYSPILVEEPLAYPLSTLALWLVARSLARPTFGALGLAVAASAVAFLTRTQLAVLLGVLVLAALWTAFDSGRGRAWRSTWSGWDWAGAGVLAAGALVAFAALLGGFSTSFVQVSVEFKERFFEHGAWAGGALAIGIGVLPVVAGIAALSRPKDEPRDPATRAFVATSASAIAVFVAYAAIKGAYLSTVFSTTIVERNLIYLYPILFAATALGFERGFGRWWAIAVGAVLALVGVAAVPIELQYPYYEAHGLAILAFANRELSWPVDRIENALYVVLALSVAIVVALALVRRRSRAFHVIAATAAVAVFAWSLTTEVYAAEGERIDAARVDDSLPRPYDWVDQATGEGSVVVIGQQIADPRGIWLTEFFNRGVKKIWSLDGTAEKAGAPILTPDLDSTDGVLTPSPETDYALALEGVELAAPIVDRRNGATLYRLDGQPIRLAASVTGLYSDGWMSDKASYTRYDVSNDGAGFAYVKLSREFWCPLGEPGRATVRIGPVAIGEDNQPTITRVTDTKTVLVRSCKAKGVALATPNEPWRIEVRIDPTFVPNELDPSKSDRRELGAQVNVGFSQLFEP